ncbi:hypothetical protein Syun_004619 [Stephania yunnanensis]|uniref:PUM-HD domain-containing protein n=1 Tax=Stephania yunnanensis TaxID=152371 RepID=A0AAP0Q104_9MAGN
MAEEQQLPRMFPRLLQPTQPPLPPNNSPPTTSRGGGNYIDSTSAASSSSSTTNFHPLTLPNSTPYSNYSLLANRGDALTSESQSSSSSSQLVCDGTHHDNTNCPFVFPLRVEIAKLKMELRKKDLDIKKLEQHVIGLLRLRTSESTPVSTNASVVHDQLGQLTIGGTRSSNTPVMNNNIRRGRSPERRASPSNYNASNLNAHLNFSPEELLDCPVLQLAVDKDHYKDLKKTIVHGKNIEEIFFMYSDLRGYIPKLCHNSYGSQLVVEFLNLGLKEMARQVFTLVLPELENLCYDPNGFVMIGAPLQHFINAVSENCMALVTDKHGCCVVQKCLQHAGTTISWLRVAEEVLKDVHHLSKHFYGNYVVQGLVDHNIFGYADRTTERLKGNFVALSMHKFSSNVVEKILNYASIGKVRDIINEIVEDPNVVELFEDCFGNFVIQKALTRTVKWQNNIFDAIAEVIENNYSTLDCHMYGKNVTICFTKLRNERRSSYRLANLEAPSKDDYSRMRITEALGPSVTMAAA